MVMDTDYYGPQGLQFARCDQDGHETVASDSELEYDLIPIEDQATHRVEILGPPEAVIANEPVEEMCAGCAGKTAETYIGFGWDVKITKTYTIG